jgi:hypothetical protein
VKIWRNHADGAVRVELSEGYRRVLELKFHIAEQKRELPVC